MKKPIKKREGIATVGVRFIYGPMVDKIYTYRIKASTSVHLGQEFPVPTKFGKRIAVIVRIDTERQDNEYNGIQYQTITERLAPL